MKSSKKFKSRKEWEEYAWSHLVDGLARATSAKEIGSSLNILLTAYEKKHMIKRAAAISLLKEGKSYKEIGELLWLSPQTISAIQKSVRAEGMHISRRARAKKKEKLIKPFTKKELARIRFTLWLEMLFTIPAPPIFPRRPSGMY